MERFAGLDKEEFRGKAGTLKSKQEGPRIQLVYCEVDVDDVDVGGNDPVFAGGEVIGVTTSGGFGHAVGKSLAFAYVTPEHAQEGSEIEFEILGDRRKARVITQPAYDPQNERLRA